MKGNHLQLLVLDTFPFSYVAFAFLFLSLSLFTESRCSIAQKSRV